MSDVNENNKQPEENKTTENPQTTGGNESRIEELKRLVEQYTLAADHDKAIECYEQLSTLTPEDGNVWTALGHCFLLKNEYHKSFSSYQQALYQLKNTKDPRLWYGIGLLYNKFECYEYAEPAFQAVINIDPEFEQRYDILYRLGNIYKKMDKYDFAISHFTQAVTEDQPANKKIDILCQIGSCYEEKKMFAEAIDYYKQALVIDDRNYKTYQYLGWAYFQIDNYAKAIENLGHAQKYVTDRYECGDIWYMLGRCYMKQASYKGTLQAFQQAIYRNANNYVYWCSIGVLYCAVKQFKDAFESFLKCSNLKSDCFEVWLNLGALYECCKQPAEALLSYQRALEIDPGNAQASLRKQLLTENSQQTPPISLQHPLVKVSNTPICSSNVSKNSSEELNSSELPKLIQLNNEQQVQFVPQNQNTTEFYNQTLPGPQIQAQEHQPRIKAKSELSDDSDKVVESDVEDSNQNQENKQAEEFKKCLNPQIQQPNEEILKQEHLIDMHQSQREIIGNDRTYNQMGVSETIGNVMLDSHTEQFQMPISLSTGNSQIPMLKNPNFLGGNSNTETLDMNAMNPPIPNFEQPKQKNQMMQNQQQQMLPPQQFQQMGGQQFQGQQHKVAQQPVIPQINHPKQQMPQQQTPPQKFQVQQNQQQQVPQHQQYAYPQQGFQPIQNQLDVKLETQNQEQQMMDFNQSQDRAGQAIPQQRPMPRQVPQQPVQNYPKNQMNYMQQNMQGPIQSPQPMPPQVPQGMQGQMPNMQNPPMSNMPNMPNMQNPPMANMQNPQMLYQGQQNMPPQPPPANNQMMMQGQTPAPIQQAPIQPPQQIHQQVPVPQQMVHGQQMMYPMPQGGMVPMYNQYQQQMGMPQQGQPQQYPPSMRMQPMVMQRYPGYPQEYMMRQIGGMPPMFGPIQQMPHQLQMPFMPYMAYNPAVNFQESSKKGQGQSQHNANVQKEEHSSGSENEEEGTVTVTVNKAQLGDKRKLDSKKEEEEPAKSKKNKKN